MSTYIARTELAQSYEVGLIQRTPVPDTDELSTRSLATLAHQAWSLKRSLDTVNETSHAFLLPSSLRSRVETFDPTAIENELARIQAEIDDIAFSLYGLDGEDRTTIEAWAKGGKTEEPGDEEPEEEAGETANDRETLLSWCVGVAFGRFDLRLATGERTPPPEPEPFDPLPVRSPGMVPEGDEPFRTNSGILIDDQGHQDDLAASVAAVLEAVTLPVPEDLRPWLARQLFPLHIKMYSRSRRKAPIFWQLATPSASFSVWLSYHTFTRDTLYRALNDHVTPKLQHEEQRLASLLQAGGPSPSANQRKEISAQEAFVEELRAFRNEMAGIAPLWNPDLDDGVIINFAPLWRLVPHHRTWQKECCDCWNKLVAGDYDWSHLSMHLWPERVVPKCVKDRSLAIAHGLEDVFWADNGQGKWHPREVEPEVIKQLIKERTSPAVKDAVVSLQSSVFSGSQSSTIGRKPRRQPKAKGEVIVK